jgi:hypothetical protein
MMIFMSFILQMIAESDPDLKTGTTMAQFIHMSNSLGQANEDVQRCCLEKRILF